jgi:hypothetical protein
VEPPGPFFSNPVSLACLSASVILIAAIIGVVWQRRISRQTLTFQTIENQIWDGDYIAARKAFIEIRDSKSAAELSTLASAASAKIPEAAAIRSVLNNYEIMAVGMMKGVLDETMYKRFFRATFMRDHEMIKPFIDALRQRSPKAFVEYTAVYEKWRKEGDDAKSGGILKNQWVWLGAGAAAAIVAAFLIF